MTRAGLNCVLSYPDVTGTTRTYQVRAGAISHGIQMIYAESEARTARAFYPHRSAAEQFGIVVLLKNWDERTDFTSWLSGYANFAIDPDIVQPYFPWMTVAIPSRDFLQYGVPLTGYEWGAHTGMMMFTPQILFECATSPGSKPGLPDVSTVINQWSVDKSDPAIQYFYPSGTQLSGSQKPVTTVTWPGSPIVYSQGPGTPPIINAPQGGVGAPPIIPAGGD